LWIYATAKELCRWFFNPDAGETVHGEAHKIRSEFVLAIKGKVRKRPEGMDNPALKNRWN